ncbi:RING finger protein 121-like isoform X1 [Biomphalaria pfeifferi]|uniref:RING finger protein 121-like isoform X1 n=1 Tax=Biomphalaria pfeifferi TaxID=112525 RepID=A0AAD8C2Q1_BIOPF|nr:RING finger protein 121-like isoform X1 [Biomphalaria pfeifferi]
MANHHEHVDGWHGEKPVNLSNVDLNKLPEKERWRVEHQMLHEKHKGHESMHAEMAIILLVTLIVAQIVLVQWKIRHFKSYQRATLIGMWLIPVVICIKFSWWRFCVFWVIFSIITGFVTYKASRKPLSGSTPRWVYKWFLLLYKLSYASGIVGYLIIMFTIFGLNMLVLVKPQTAMDFGLLLLFYGLYFGVVSRDFAEVCADTMAAHIGYYSTTGLPAKRLDSNTCAVCGNEIFIMSNDNAVIEKTIKLNCGHIFHEFCIRGWCIVGKKQTCPYCKEKVDLKRMFPGPWERPHVMYGNLLDWIRYLVAWQPVIIGIVQVINWALGLE